MLLRALVTLTMSVELANGVDVIEVRGDIGDKSILCWNETDYDAFNLLFNNISDCVLRYDADFTYKDCDKHTETPEYRDNVKDFDKYQLKVVDSIRLLRALCPIRKSIVTLLKEDSTYQEDEVPVDRTLLEKFWYVDSLRIFSRFVLLVVSDKKLLSISY